jgi:hypothetical protein
MKHGLSLTVSARHEVDQILLWLHERSPAGATSWYAALTSALEEVTKDPKRFARAMEAKDLNRDLFETVFRTSRGRRYRLIFECRSSSIIIVGVRGPGQPPMSADALAADV